MSIEAAGSTRRLDKYFAGNDSQSFGNFEVGLLTEPDEITRLGIEMALRTARKNSLINPSLSEVEVMRYVDIRENELVFVASRSDGVLGWMKVRKSGERSLLIVDLEAWDELYYMNRDNRNTREKEIVTGLLVRLDEYANRNKIHLLKAYIRGGIPTRLREMGWSETGTETGEGLRIISKNLA